MATKSRVRKKNGKPVKYKAKPKGLSKTKMKKLLQMIEEQQKSAAENSAETPEIREGEGELLISPDFIKKLNVASEIEVEDGPELAEESMQGIPEDSLKKEEEEEVLKGEEEEEKEGPISSDI